MGLNLGFNEKDYKLVWAGMSGMSRYCVVSLLHSMVNYFGLPYAVLIHCGGNDIGIEPCGKLLFDMKFMFFVISQMLPGSKIMFSSILPRLSWRYSEDLKAMDDTRKRLNRGLKSYLKKLRYYTIVYADFEDKHPSLFANDGIHLSFIGNDMFMHAMQSALEQFILTPHNLVFPIDL